MADRQGVEIDYCPRCRGVWLDRGELDKIIDRSLSRGTTHEDRDPDSDRHGQRNGDYHRRKKSWLSEIFD